MAFAHFPAFLLQIALYIPVTRSVLVVVADGDENLTHGCIV